jgi:hypothetical protein
MDWVRPQSLQEGLELKPGNPAHLRLDRPFPLLTPSGGSPALTPYRSMTPAVDTAQKKGIDFKRPVKEADFCWFTNECLLGVFCFRRVFSQNR